MPHCPKSQDIRARREPRSLDLLRLPLAAWNRALLVCVRSDKTRVDRKSVGADQTLRQAPWNDGLEKAAQHVALAKAPVSVLRERRVIGDSAVQSESAEPAIGEIEVNLVAKATLGPDAHAVANDQH